MYSIDAEQHFTERVCRIRDDIYGEAGIPELAEALGLPAETWEAYEDGLEMPATVLLRFLCLTGAEPLWLLTGQGWPLAPRSAALQSLSIN